jgi:PIN domain nuclease of toxin-antitoxin system
MRLLLDTHAFLWFVLNDPAISPKARDLIADPDNDLYLSPASHWEIAIKVSIGKYQIPGSFESWVNQQFQINEIGILPIKIAHTAAVIHLPFHHKDPFDRLLLAQSITENMPIVSADRAFDAYGVSRLW